MCAAINTQGSTDHHRVVIVGGGAAGITVAAILRRHRHDLDIALLEPLDSHYYQPAFTLVGGGVYDMAKTRRAEAGLIPPSVRWIKDAAAEFDPDKNAIGLKSGRRLTYDMLVVCPGIQIDIGKIEGLEGTLGRGRVTSNYLPDYAPYTWQCLKEVKGGETLLFTMPPMPIKCPGAPQKIAYLASDYLRRKGLRHSVTIEYLTATPTMFSVPYFAGPLLEVAKGHGIAVHFNTNLKAIDAQKKIATFEAKEADGSTKRVEKTFDMIHVSPPQSAPEVVKKSPLANDAGWVDIDPNGMRHKRFANVFALGDAGSTPNSKSAAAVRKQAPIVVRNLLAALDEHEGGLSYDGYGSCPLTTAYGKVMLAEFTYGGKVTPSFPLDPKVERTSMWYLKKYFLPYLYWQHMLKGKEFDIAHKERYGQKAAA